MKQAVDKSGQVIDASADCAPFACCPHCGASVTLRQRSDGKGGKTYFWRHQDHANLDCPARFSAYSPISTPVSSE